jgi:hypothetical protein
MAGIDTNAVPGGGVTEDTEVTEETEEPCG